MHHKAALKLGHIKYFTSVKHLFLLLLVLSVLSCKTEEEIPLDKLSMEQMIDLHIEFHLAEARVRELRVPIDSGMMLYRYIKQDILAQRNLNDSIYEDSYQWYLEHPIYFQQVYEQVIDSLKYLHEVVVPARRQDPKAKNIKPEQEDPDENKGQPGPGKKTPAQVKPAATTQPKPKPTPKGEGEG